MLPRRGEQQLHDVVAVAGQERRGSVDALLRVAVERIVILLSPFVPHIAEEMWQLLGHAKDKTVFRCKWPSYDKNAIIEKILTIPVQVNGRLRTKIEVPAGIDDGALKELVMADPKVKSWIGEKGVKDFIIIPKKLVNVVTSAN